MACLVDLPERVLNKILFPLPFSSIIRLKQASRQLCCMVKACPIEFPYYRAGLTIKYPGVAMFMRSKGTAQVLRSFHISQIGPNLFECDVTKNDGIKPFLTFTIEAGDYFDAAMDLLYYGMQFFHPDEARFEGLTGEEFTELSIHIPPLTKLEVLYLEHAFILTPAAFFQDDVFKNLSMLDLQADAGICELEDDELIATRNWRRLEIDALTLLSIDGIFTILNEWQFGIREIDTLSVVILMRAGDDAVLKEICDEKRRVFRSDNSEQWLQVDVAPHSKKSLTLSVMRYVKSWIGENEVPLPCISMYAR